MPPRRQKKKSSSGALGRTLHKAANKRAHAKKSKRAQMREREKLEQREQNLHGAHDSGLSLTDQSSLESFIANAKMSQREFTTERSKLRIVGQSGAVHTVGDSETDGGDKLVFGSTAGRAADLDFRNLGIPRRPPWTKEMSREELQGAERNSFLEWRRGIAKLEEENQHLAVTPFEKNLNFWRQLWRTMERSDVVVQIVDARNPLLFRCPDVDAYAKELSECKENLLVVNKADLLSAEMRTAWATYFRSKGIKFAYFSAKLEKEALDAEDDEDGDDTLGILARAQELAREKVGLPAKSSSSVLCSDKPISRTDLLMLLTERAAEAASRRRAVEKMKMVAEGESGRGERKSKPATVGMVGYPNVGKSSVINVLLGVTAKSHGKTRVAVASTPGKTKHFQTIVLSGDLTLCDCPGLCFPTFMSSKAEMICNGILPIDQLRDHVPPISVVVKRISADTFEETYGIELPRATVSGMRLPVNPRSLLQTYAIKRGFMAGFHSGPDEPRTARLILKDYVSGKLCFCHPPPGHKNESDRGANVDEAEVAQLVVGGLDVNGNLALGDPEGDAADVADAADTADALPQTKEDASDMKFINTDSNAASLEMDLEMMELLDEKIAFDTLRKEVTKKQKHKSRRVKGRRRGKNRVKGNPYEETEAMSVFGVDALKAPGIGVKSKRVGKKR
eukprot:g3405.t1